jgi:hypothetical protein
VLRYKRRKITLKNNLSIKKPPFQEDLSKLKLRSSQRIKILPVGDIGNVGGRVPIRYLSMGIMFLDHRGHRGFCFCMGFVSFYCIFLATDIHG